MVALQQEEKDLRSSTIKIYDVGVNLIDKAVKSENDTEQIVVKINLHNNSQWIDVMGQTFKQLVRIKTQLHEEDIFGDATYSTAITNIHAEALLNGTMVKPVFTRCAFVDGALYYDLQNYDGLVYKITKKEHGFVKIDETTPIFLKSPSAKTMQSSQYQPKFDNEKAFDEFISLCRVKDDDKIIFKSHIIAYFLTGFPVPITVLHGEQGTAKTTTGNAIKSMIDPEGENAMSLPKENDDIAVVLSKHYISHFDNTDEYTKENSDLLCRAVTGTQYPKRKLYTNGDEFSLTLKTKIILNGITPSIEQPDLLDRSVFYELPVIPKEERLTDDDYVEKLKKLKPDVLGFIFQTLQKAFEIYDEVKKDLSGSVLPRMASFAVWGEAISRSLGHQENMFIERYFEKVDTSKLSLTEEYPIINPLIDYMQDKDKKEILISELYTVIVDIDKIKTDDRLPKDSIRLGKQLRKLAPILRTMGYEVSTRINNKRRNDFKRGSTIVTITKIVEKGINTFSGDDG